MYYSEISFPGLGITMDPLRSFSIGPVTIHLYGLIIACGLMLAAFYAMKRSKQFGLNEDVILDGVLWIVPFAILCARLYYCAFTWDSYRDNPVSVLYIWEGGLAIYGGVMGAVIGILVFCKIRKIKVGAVLDIVALGFLIGQAIGRWGNFFNREAFGSETECFMRMGLLNTLTNEIEYHHPTFLYESLWNAAGFVLLHFWSKHRKYDGQIALGYVSWYGLGRMVVEGLRTDSLYWGPFRVSQVLAGISFLVAAGALIFFHFRPHDPAKLFVNQVAAAAELKSAETVKSAEEEETAGEEQEEKPENKPEQE